MSDIVERLRDVAGFIEKEHGRVASAACLATEAADEIERLRAALRELLWYTNQLEINVYDPDEWPKVHEAVKTARAALDYRQMKEEE